MFAAVAAGVYEKAEDAQQAMGQGFAYEYQPDETHHAVYMELYKKYQAIGQFTSEL
jgi:L-ribulokinase